MRPAPIAFLVLAGILVLTIRPAMADPPAPLIDNARVTVRDVTLAPGAPGPAIAHGGDYVVLYVTGGRIQGADGMAAAHADGSTVFGHGGATRDTALDGPAHEIVVELKDAPAPMVPNPGNLPPGFPRPGAVKVFENGRVIVWNYAWAPGVPTPLHIHDKDVIVFYRGGGPLKSTAPDGTVTVNRYHAGEIRFNPAGRAHTEELTDGAQSGVMLELK